MIYTIFYADRLYAAADSMLEANRRIDIPQGAYVRVDYDQEVTWALYENGWNFIHSNKVPAAVKTICLLMGLSL